MLTQNLRYAFRFMRHNPGFTAVIVLTLALGIGANTAIFSVVYSALLRPLPYRNPSELLFLGESREQYPQIDLAQSSYPDFRDWQRSSKTFQSLAGYGGDGFILDTGGEPKLESATTVTANFFSTLGVKLALGRDFVDGEDKSDGPHRRHPQRCVLALRLRRAARCHWKFDSPRWQARHRRRRASS